MAGTGITYTLEVAWGGSLEGLFRINVSTVGGTDVIAGWPDDVGFEDVTGDTVGFATGRGRSNDKTQMLAGTATIRLRDQSGLYNPANMGSSLYPNVKPFRPVRIKATYSGTTYGLFYGFLTSIGSSADPDSPVTQLECADLFSWLTLRKPTISATSTTTTGAAIGLILDGVAWPATLRSLDAGDTIPDFSADGSKNCLSLINDLLQSEMGLFYMDGSGVATFDNRNARFASVATSADIDGASDTLMGFQSSNNISTIYNAASVTMTGSTAQTATDTDSINAFGRRDMGGLTTPYISTDAAAQARANLRVLRYKDPKNPSSATMVSSSTTTPSMLGSEIGWRVRMTEPFGGTDKDFFVESISQTSEASAGVQRHITEWGLSEVPAAAGIPVIINVTGIGNYIGV